MGRIRDALLVLLQGSYHDQFRRAISDVRTLQVELTSALEMLNAWAAREYKRRVRATKDLVEGPATPAAPAAPAPSDVASSMRRRGAIIQRAMATQRALSRGPHVEATPPSETQSGTG